MGDDPKSPLDHAAIAERAYLHWQSEGRPEGRADAHWQTAERELRVERDATDDRENALHLHTGVEITNTDRALPPMDRRRVRKARQPPAEATGAASALPSHFVVTLDRAHLRIYRASKTAGPGPGQLQLEHSVDLPAGRENYTARDTDQAGRFSSAHGGPPGGSIDERLPMQQEHNRRLADELAAEVEAFLQQHPDATWDFAAGPALHHTVLENLSPAIRRRLGVAVPKDLVNQSVDSWREHFGTGSRKRARGAAGTAGNSAAPT